MKTKCDGVVKRIRVEGQERVTYLAYRKKEGVQKRIKAESASYIQLEDDRRPGREVMGGGGQ